MRSYKKRETHTTTFESLHLTCFFFLFNVFHLVNIVSSPFHISFTSRIIRFARLRVCCLCVYLNVMFCFVFHRHFDTYRCRSMCDFTIAALYTNTIHTMLSRRPVFKARNENILLCRHSNAQAQQLSNCYSLSVSVLPTTVHSTVKRSKAKERSTFDVNRALLVRWRLYVLNSTNAYEQNKVNRYHCHRQTCLNYDFTTDVRRSHADHILQMRYERFLVIAKSVFLPRFFCTCIFIGQQCRMYLILNEKKHSKKAKLRIN